tara:strand:+ start:6299 stop:6556 length:258 start_codon:yes stop_codon:yes gene_type:complete
MIDKIFWTALLFNILFCMTPLFLIGVEVPDWIKALFLIGVEVPDWIKALFLIGVEVPDWIKAACMGSVLLLSATLIICLLIKIWT